MPKIISILKAYKWLIILGLWALFSVSSYGNDLLILASLNSDIQPFSWLISHAVSAFIFMLLVVIISKLTPVKWYLSIVIAAILLALPAFWFNFKSSNQVSELLASDVDNLNTSTKIEIKILAYINNRGYTGDPVCDDFCARILLNHGADKIIIANWQGISRDNQFNITGTAFWLERQDNCEKPEISANLNRLNLISDNDNFDTETPEGLMLLNAGHGECLRHENANMSQADAALVYGVFKRGQTEFNAGLDIFANAVDANRLSFYQREAGLMQLKFQSTLAQNNDFQPLSLPYLSLDNFASQLAFMRVRNAADSLDANNLDIPFTDFLTDKLKLYLWLNEPEIGEQIGQILMTTVGGSGEVGAAKLQIIDELFENIDITSDLYSGRANMYLAIFKDRRIPITQYSGNVLIDEIHGNPDLIDDFANVLFERLAEYQLKPDQNENAELQNIGIALSYLPKSVFPPHFEALKTLAINRNKRTYLAPLLSHLADIGAPSLPILLQLVDEANNQSNTEQNEGNDSARWEGIYLTGMDGLCKLAQSNIDKTSLKAEILKRLNQGNIALYGNYGEKFVHLLYALEFKPDEIWQKLQKIDDKYERISFDEQISRAQIKNQLRLAWLKLSSRSGK